MSTFSDSTIDDQSLEVNANPSKFNFLDQLSLSNEVKYRLSTHLTNLAKGSDNVYLTPIGRDNDKEYVLSKISKILDSGLVIDELLEFENSNRSKFSPRSIALNWSDRKDSLLSYFEGEVSFNNDLLCSSNHKLNKCLRPLSVSNASKFLKSNTNSGLPFYTRKSKVKDTVVKDFNSLLDEGFPCILFTRTQEGNKTRNVWGYPIADTLNEMRFYQPLLSYQKNLPWRSALIGPGKVDESISKMFIDRDDSKTFLSIDFSAYDASVKFSLQQCSFDYIKSLYQPIHAEEIDSIMHRFNTIGIVTPSGIYEGPHGIPSGSTFTNEVDSIAQFLIFDSLGLDAFFEIQGDDGLYHVDSSEVDTIIKNFKRYGLSVNEDKSIISGKYCTYLQRFYHSHYMVDGHIGGIYSIYRAMNRIFYQERYSDFESYGLSGRDYYSIRTITILENCKYHPHFKDFVKFVHSLDKYLLEFSEASVSKYDKMLNSGSGTGGVLNNQFGDNVRGISSFETVKVLGSLR